MNVAGSAVVLGEALADASVYLAQGAVVRSIDGGVHIGAHSAVLENCVVIGTPTLPVAIGAKVVFGHRCVVVGAAVGDLSEIGNGTIVLPGATVGQRVFTGEGTVIPAGAVVPDDAVVVGNPARRVRSASPDDVARLTRLRGG